MHRVNGPGRASLLLGSLLSIPLCAHAQSEEASTFQSEYAKRLKAYETIQPHGETPFGESIDLATGQVSFTHTDIVLEGTGPAIRISRSRNATGSDPSGNGPAQLLGDWTLNIPRISTLVPAPRGVADGGDPGLNWRRSFATDATSLARCAGFGDIYPGQGGIPLEEWWHGYELTMDDGSTQPVLKRDAAFTTKPSTGSAYPAVTLSDVQIRCLPTTSNGKSGDAFLAIAPDGTKYWFDHLVGIKASPVQKLQLIESAAVQADTTSEPREAEGDLEPSPMTPGGGAVYQVQERMQAAMLVSRIEDRFGNAVVFTYGYNDYRPTAITATDGRKVALAWNGTLLTSATAQPDTPSDARTWRYEYTDWKLSGVVLPDNSRWSFNLLRTGEGALADMFANSCTKRYNANAPASDSEVSTVTAPSGLVGTFVMRHRWHARSYAYSACSATNTGASYETVPPLSENLSLVQRTMSGLGVPTQAWTYTYGPAQASANHDACARAGTCVDTEWVDVTEPDGARARYTHSTRDGAMEGKLLKVETFDPGGTSLRTEVTQYPTLATLPFVSRLGDSLRGPRTNLVRLEHRFPTIGRVITQQGRNFNWTVPATCAANKLCFDFLGRVTRTIRSSTPAPTSTRTDDQTYEDNLGAWVLGQPKKSTNVDTGLVESETVYDAVTALPLRTYRFGKLQQTLTYATDGNVATASDGRDSGAYNTTVALGGWKRGIPQTITFPDATAMSAVVDAYGLIRSVTNEMGAKTCYDFDAMGRLSKVTHPSERQPGVCDTSTWAATNITFDDGYPAAYGMPAGHWRQTRLTGSGRKVVVFDALWRPVVEQTLDLATQQISEVVRRYDHDGHVVFESYPMATAGQAIWNDTTLDGTRTTYDAIGRVTRVEQDSELGPLATITQYQNNFQTLVTNPRQKTTLTSYFAWDQPSFDLPRDITRQGDVITSISRDVFGKPTTITRRNAASTVWIRRYWAYNAQQELCKRMEVETGTTLMHYDAAGNLDWSATGLPWSNPAVCDDIADATITPQKITRQYDQRNRLKVLAHPDGQGDTTSVYTNDGKLASITADNADGKVVTSSYAYNKRGLLTNETLRWGPVNWPVDYTYNANGHLATQAWHGVTVDYAPNSLGQPTKAGSFASGVTYHPNGGMKQFTYGNGIVHTLTQNTRGLPDTSRDAYGSSNFLYDAYDYDANGNVAAISDGRPGARGNRTMGYDDLDRLASVNSPMFNGTIAYTYDATDNIVTLTAPSTPMRAQRNLRYCYGSSNRISFIRSNAADCNSGAATVAYGYTGNSGNVTSRNATTYRFDKGDRLREVGGTTSAQYAYDGHGRRVWDYTTADSYSHYSLDGRLLMNADHRAWKVRDYVQLNGSLLAIRERDVPTGVYTVKYQHTDALGTPVVMTDGNRVEIDRREYEPYGEVINQAVEDGPGFTGHVEDAATGLTYMQQRYYDPTVGRFLSVDPVTTLDGGQLHFNRYTYAYNNPYKFTDPDGRCPICIPAIIFGIGALLHSEPANAPAPGETPVRTSPGDAAAAAIPGARPAKTAISGANAAGKLSQRAATREAKRQASIPTSQQPSSQSNARASDGTQVGRQQSFEIPKPGGGTETKSVQVSRDTRGDHAGMTQIEAGAVKPGGQVDSAGRPRIQNEDKVRVDFDPKH